MKHSEDGNLYIIMKDGKPYYGGNSDNFVKAYYDKELAHRTMKAHCTGDARRHFEYGDGRSELEKFDYPERMTVRKILIKEKSQQDLKNWSLKVVPI